MTRPWVIKLGGSLAASDSLMTSLRAIQDLHDVVLVPGGGAFADTVRAQQNRHGFDDSAAHAMALLAMDQYGLMLIALGGGRLSAARDEAAIRARLRDGRIPVWLPARRADPDPSIARSWSFTSDSLALWVAQRIDAAGVLLIKSVAIDAGAMPTSEAVARGWVDPSFAGLRAQLACPVRLLGPAGQGALRGIVAGGAGGLDLR